MTFARELASDTVEAAQLTRRHFGRASRALLVPAALAALASARSLSPALSGFLGLIMFATWLMAANTIVEEYAHDRTESDSLRRPVHAGIVLSEAIDVGWPAALVSVVWLVALWTTFRQPGAAIAVNLLFPVAFALASVIAGWAFSFVVSDVALAAVARRRVIAAFRDRTVLARAVAVAVFLLLFWIALRAGAHAVAWALFPAHARFGNTAMFGPIPLTEALLGMACDLVWWSFAYALIFVTRPTVDLTPLPADAAWPPAATYGARPELPARPRRRGEIIVPPFMQWAVRLFTDPPTKAD